MKVVIDPNAFDVAMTFMAIGIMLAVAMAAWHFLEFMWPNDRNKRKKPPTNSTNS